ncbi:hypothetical protein CP8484711_0794B, partial [Chlamydia psittaci 84-8471/1]
GLYDRDGRISLLSVKVTSTCLCQGRRLIG